MQTVEHAQPDLVLVRIADVPLATRLSAAQRACRREREEQERARILALALEPGELTAWVTEDELKVVGL